MSRENHALCLHGSLISEHFSVWLKSPKNGAKSEIGAKVKNCLRLSREDSGLSHLSSNLFCMKMNLVLRLAYCAVSLSHIQNALSAPPLSRLNSGNNL